MRPYAAALTTLSVGATLTEAERHALRAALISPDATAAIPRAVNQGSQWRPWMIAFAPGSDADADLKNVWTPLAPHPPAQALALLARRSSKR